MSSKISGLPAMTTLTGSELITGVQSGANANVTPAQIATFVGAASAQVFAGNYSGGVPGFTPTTIAIAFDTSTGAQWNFYSGQWH